MKTQFSIPYMDRLNSAYDAAGEDMQSMMHSQLSGESVDEGEFSKRVAKRLCAKDVLEAVTKDACRLSNMLVKDNG